MVHEYKLFIGGELRDSSTGEVFDDINPASLENLATLQVAGIEDVDRAVEAAEIGFRIWSEIPAPRRAEVLLRAARILQERKEELAVLMTKEMGKILPETRGRCAGSHRYYILCRRGRETDAWRDNNLRTQGKTLYDFIKAYRGCGYDYALEFSYCNPQLEDNASPCDGKRNCFQTCK